MRYMLSSSSLLITGIITHVWLGQKRRVRGEPLFETTVVVLLILVVIYIGVGYFFVVQMSAPAKDDSDLTPETFGLKYECVTIGGNHTAWHIHAGGTVTIVTVPAFGGTKLKLQGQEMVPFWKAAVESGFSILALSDFNESTIIKAANYLARSSTPGDIILHGFSIGASTTLYAGSKLPIKAIIADGAADNVGEAMYVDLKRHRLIRLFVPALRLVMKVSQRLNLGSLYALQTIHFVGCPVLLVYGEQEPIVAQGMNDGLMEYAKNHCTRVQSWLIPNAEHCTGVTNVPDAYVTRIAQFLGQMISS